MNRLFVRVSFITSSILLCLSFSQTTFAHHSFSAEFDNIRGEISGVVVRARYTNPHPRYQILVTLENGTSEEWELQGQSVTSMRAGGWDSDFLSVGDEIRVWGSLGRNDTKKLFLSGLEKSNGEIYDPSANASTRPNPGEVNATVGRNYTYGQLNESAPFDISGPWRNSYKFRVTVDDLEPKPTPFTTEGAAIYAETEHYDDYSLRCVAPGLPRIFGAPYDMDIVDAGSHYQFVYIEHNTPRRIYMDGRVAPDNFPDTAMGWSNGHWEGDELVIETTKLVPGWLDGSGMPFMGGENTRLLERYTFADDRLSMERVLTIYDAYYTEPLIRRRASARDDNVVITEHDSCDPTSYYSDIFESGELERRLDDLL